MKKFNLKAVVFDGVTFCFLFLVLTVLVTQPTEEQMLNLGFNSLLSLGYFILGGIISYVFNQNLNLRTWGEQIFLPPQKKATDQARSLILTFWGWQAIVVLIVTLIVGLVKTKFSFYEITNPDGFDGAVRLFQGIFSPDWSLLPKAVLNIIETIFMAFIATALAIPVAFVLSFFAAKNIMKGPLVFVYLLIRTILNVTRSVEALIWAIIFSVWVGIGPFAGMLALMIHSIASLAKQYSEMVESVSEGPIEGILSTGANKLQMVWFAIVPQVILPYISFTVYRWDINVRMATIIGLVGGGGIGTLLIQYQGQAMWPQVGCIIVVIAVVVWLLDQASAYLREALK
jgi:phosphonate transport system permease protein